jgi:hypothetical protein
MDFSISAAAGEGSGGGVSSALLNPGPTPSRQTRMTVRNAIRRSIRRTLGGGIGQRLLLLLDLLSKACTDLNVIDGTACLGTSCSLAGVAGRRGLKRDLRHPEENLCAKVIEEAGPDSHAIALEGRLWQLALSGILGV